MGVPNGVSLDNFGNVYVASSTDTTGVIAKFDTAGDTLWVRRYSESGKETYFGKIQNNDSNIYILGFNYESFPLNSDILTLKYNSEGIFKWAVKYTGPRPYGLDQVRGIAIDESGNTYVTGIADNGSSSRYDMATIKYDWNGVQKWVKIYNGAANLDDAPSAIKTDHSGNVIITGYSQWSGALGGINYTTIKYNSIGDTLWTRFYNGPSNDEDIAYDLDVDTTNKVYVTGRSLTTGTIYDIATLKYDENGQQIWSKIYDGFGKNDIGLSVETDNSLNVYVSGTSKNILVDLLTIKYSQVVGLATIISEAPCDFQLLQNYPNPFNPYTKIRFKIAKSSTVQIKIYDVLGRELKELVNADLKPAGYEVDFDGSNFASGVYFYSIISDGNMISTKTMILNK